MAQIDQSIELLNEVTVRKAVPEDAEAIANIISTGWIDTYCNDELGLTKEYLTEFRKVDQKRIDRTREWLRSEDCNCWVAIVGGKVVGETAPHIDEKGRNRVGALYILKEYRSHGIGKQLMGKVYEIFRGKGEIYLECATYNERAIRFYEKCGFHKVEELGVGRFNLDDGKYIPVITMIRPE